MSRISASARVRLAEAELAQAQVALAKSAKPWGSILRRHRAAITVIGGFASGIALTLLPTHWWSRFGAVLGATAAGMARSALTPAVVGAALSQLRRGAADPAASEERNSA